MVEWINYLEATTSSTMISLTPQNAQLRRRFPFFLFIFFFDYCSSIGAVAILYQRYRKKKNIVSRSIVCGFSFDANRTCLAIQRRSAGQFI